MTRSAASNVLPDINTRIIAILEMELTKVKADGEIYKDRPWQLLTLESKLYRL